MSASQKFANLSEVTTGDEAGIGRARVLEDEPPGVLAIIGVLLGQMDGRVEITDEALVALEPMELAWWRDDRRNCSVIELRPSGGLGSTQEVTNG